MNAWKLNGMVGHVCRMAIVKSLSIPFSDIYKAIRDIKSDGTIVLKNGEEYEVILKKKENESRN